ncbi:hypothetical protein pb186bvf_006945 [Paramecium bursaria]
MIKNKGISKKNRFIQKTHEMLKNCSNRRTIQWIEQGDKFCIMNIKLFIRDILPKFFAHSNYASFLRSLNMYGFSSYKNKKGQKIIFHKYFKQCSVQYAMFHRTQPNLQQEDETIQSSSEDLQEILKELLYQQNIMKQQIIQQVKFMQEIKNQYIQHLRDLLREYVSGHLRGQKFLILLFKILRGLELPSYDSKNQLLDLIFINKENNFINSPQPKDEYGIFFDDSVRSSPITHNYKQNNLHRPISYQNYKEANDKIILVVLYILSLELNEYYVNNLEKQKKYQKYTNYEGIPFFLPQIFVNLDTLIFMNINFFIQQIAKFYAYSQT